MLNWLFWVAAFFAATHILTKGRRRPCAYGYFELSCLRICPLKSSSKGNSTLITNENTKILVDCGISGKALCESLKKFGVSAAEIDAILITHEHTDHTKGVGVASRKYNLPIYLNALTWNFAKSQIGRIEEENLNIFGTGDEFYINDIKVKSFHTPHDAAESVGFVFEDSSGRAAIATDMGFVTDEVLSVICGCDTVLIEANYDLNMLEIGSYPYELKQRIKGNRGHLCNDDSGALAKILAESGVKEIILGHLSEENNFPLLALKTVENFFTNENSPLISVVDRNGEIIKG